MTELKYMMEAKIGTSAELIRFKSEDPKGFDTLKAWAREEMKAHNIEVATK